MSLSLGLPSRAPSLPLPAPPFSPLPAASRLLESFQLPLVVQLEGQLEARRLRISAMQAEMDALRRQDRFFSFFSALASLQGPAVSTAL